MSTSEPKYNEYNIDKLAQHLVEFGMSTEDLMSYVKEDLEEHFKHNEEEFFIEWENQFGDKP